LPNNNFSKNWQIILGSVVLLLVYTFLFKFTGARFILTLSIFALPSYLMLNLFDLEDIEKIIFSFFISISIISSSVYWLSFLTNSIRLTFLSIVIFLTAIALIFNILKNKKLFLFEEKHKSKED
jgi:uncharacterized membrane protein